MQVLGKDRVYEDSAHFYVFCSASSLRQVLFMSGSLSYQGKVFISPEISYSRYIY